MDWLQIAKALPIGRSRRLAHGCNPNGARSLTITHEPECYRGYCHRCKETLYESKRLSLGELIQLNRDRKEADHNIARDSLPEPMVFGWEEWPVEAQVWLLKAGIGEADALRYGIYYHPPTMRVVLPYANGFQARAVMAGHKPKYVADRNPRRAVILKPDGLCHCHLPVLTEDILSSIKITMAGINAMPLRGTQLHDEHIVRLLPYGRAAVWLDPDDAGQTAATKIVKRLEVFGIDARNIVGDVDPKYHTRDEIRNALEVAFGP